MGTLRGQLSLKAVDSSKLSTKLHLCLIFEELDFAPIEVTKKYVVYQREDGVTKFYVGGRSIRRGENLAESCSLSHRIPKKAELVCMFKNRINPFKDFLEFP